MTKNNNEAHHIHRMIEVTTLQQEAIEFFLNEDVLRFGEFTLKSGRRSPYYFNTGVLSNARQLKRMGELYARMIQSVAVFNNANVVFGSAYKGIPISVATAIALADTDLSDIRAVSDRKEAKTHGDSGSFLGVITKGDSVVIVDDVIATGGTKLEALEKLRQIDCEPLGLIIAFDRAEPAEGSTMTAKESFEKISGLPVYALATVHDVAAIRPEFTPLLDSYLAQFKK